jgi:hypothetical protein
MPLRSPGARVQVLGVDLVKTGFAQLEFLRGARRGNLSGTELRQKMPDQGRCYSMNDLLLFTAAD